VEGNAVVVFRVGDEPMQRVINVLTSNGVPILKAKDVYEL